MLLQVHCSLIEIYCCTAARACGKVIIFVMLINLPVEARFPFCVNSFALRVPQSLLVERYTIKREREIFLQRLYICITGCTYLESDEICLNSANPLRMRNTWNTVSRDKMIRVTPIATIPRLSARFHVNYRRVFQRRSR